MDSVEEGLKELSGIISELIDINKAMVERIAELEETVQTQSKALTHVIDASKAQNGVLRHLLTKED